MKSAKNILALFTLLLLPFLNNTAHATTTGKGKTIITITSTTTHQQLDSMKTALGLQGIEMDIEGTIYSKAGTLKRISGSITASPKSSAKFSSDNVGTILITIKGTSIKVESKDLPAQ